MSANKTVLNAFLSGIILCCTILGLFPSASPFVSSENFEFVWRHPVTIYTLTVVAVNSFLGVDFLLHGVETYIEAAGGHGTANVISGYIRSYNFVVSDIFVRVCALVYCKKSIDIIRMVRELHRTAVDISQIPEKCQLKKQASGNVIELNEGDEGQTGKTRRLGHIYEGESHVNHNPWKLNTMLGTVMVFQIWNTYERVKPVVGGQPQLQTVFRFTSDERWLRISWIAHAILSCHAHFFPFLACIVVGGEMTSIYCKYKYALLLHLRGKSFPLEYTVSFRRRFTREFKLLMKMFDYFSEIGAAYACISIVVGTVAMAQYLYSYIDTWHFPSLANAFSCFYWVLLTSILGNSMQANIQKGREEVRNILATETSQTFVNEELTEIAKWMCTWKWKFAPFNLFVVNNHMIVAACGTVLTQVIFLFQLKMSETTVCGESNCPVCECGTALRDNASAH